MPVTNKAIGIGAASLATAAFFGFRAAGKLGDCSPHEVDGQCGLSTFIGLLYGGAAAVVITSAAAILIAVRVWRADRSVGKTEA